MLPDHILHTSTLEVSTPLLRLALSTKSVDWDSSKFFQGKHSTFGSPNTGILIRVGEIVKNLSRNMGTSDNV